MNLITSSGNTPREAVREALSKSSGKVLFAVVYGKISSDLSAQIEEAKTELGKIPLIGATTGGGQFNEDVFSQDKFIAGLVESTEDAEADVFIVRNLNKASSEKLKELFRRLSERAKTKNFKNHSMVVLLDAFAIAGDDLIDYIKASSSPFIKLAGGMAGDHWQFKETKVFYNSEVLSNAMVGISIYSSKKIGIGVKHGWKKLSFTPMKITRSDGNILYELNGKPALEMWKEVLAEEGIEIDPENPVSTLARYELGIETVISAEPIIRAPLSINDDGSVVLAGKVRAGAKAYIMKMTLESLYEGAKNSIEQAMAGIDGEPAGAFIFSCAARLANIGPENYIKEVQTIKNELNAPILGFNTYGEIAKQTGEIMGFHNTTVVSMVLPK